MDLSDPTDARRLTAALAIGMLMLAAACGSADTLAQEPGPDVGTTVPTPTIQPDPSADEEPTSEEFVEYGPPTVEIEIDGDRTTPVAQPLADGVYFTQTYEAVDGSVTFTLTQYFLCDSSTNVPDEPSVVCASGFGTLDQPTVTARLDPNATISVATGDLDDPTRADVSAAEFTRLVDGEAPAAGAPDGYAFSPFLMFIEVGDGVVVAGEQFYTS